MATVSLVITSAKNSTDKLPRICDYYISPCNTTFTLVQWHISVNNSCTLKVAFSLTYWYIYWSNSFLLVYGPNSRRAPKIFEENIIIIIRLRECGTAAAIVLFVKQ